MISRVAFAAAMALALSPMTAHAQTEENGRQIYEAAFFERFAPQNARDMIFRIPGFSIRDTSGGRGLGQGGANVLINGERQTSKDTSALDILGQTPASNVVRIEIVDAASLGVTGLTGQVANVIVEQGSFSGNWEYNPQFRDGLKPRVSRGSVSVSGQVGGTDYSIGFANNSFRNGHRGPEYVYDANRELVFVREEDEQYYGENPELTVSLSGGDKKKLAYNLTTKGALFEFNGSGISQRSEDIRWVTKNSEDEWNAEVSADVTKTLGQGDAKLIAYHRTEHSPFVNRLMEYEDDVLSFTDSFSQTSDEAETIGRFEYVLPRPNERSWEFAAEYAFNQLDTESSFETDEGGVVDFEELDPVTVMEDRLQSSLTYNRRVFTDLALQLSLGSEYSEIQSEVAGVESEVRSFFRPKGFLTLAYPVNDKSDIRARFERSVGQLNFFAFVSSQDLQDDLDFQGNTSLVPQQSWDGEIEFERRFGDEDKIILRAAGSLIEDRVDNIVIDGQEAVGNIDEAKQLSLEAEGTFLTDRWGIKGGRIDFHGERRFSQLEDPLTGEDRPFSGNITWRTRWEFRHDIPDTDYAYGFFANHIEFEDRLSARTQSVFYFSEPQAEIWVQHKDFFGKNLSVYAVNLLNQDERFDRTVYDEEDLRAEGQIDFIEERSRDYGIIVGFNLAGTF